MCARGKHDRKETHNDADEISPDTVPRFPTHGGPPHETSIGMNTLEIFVGQVIFLWLFASYKKMTLLLTIVVKTPQTVTIEQDSQLVTCAIQPM